MHTTLLTRLLHPTGEMMSLAHPFVRDIFHFIFQSDETAHQRRWTASAYPTTTIKERKLVQPPLGASGRQTVELRELGAAATVNAPY